MKSRSKISSFLAVGLSVWILIFPALAGAATNPPSPGDELVLTSYIGDELSATDKYVAYEISTALDESAVTMYLPVEGTGESTLTPITPDQVESFLAWYGVTATKWSADLEESSIPVAWYMEMAQSYSDPAQATELMNLLAQLGTATENNEYYAFREFLGATGVTAAEFSQTLDGININEADYFQRMENMGASFNDLTSAFLSQPMELSEFLNYNTKSADSKVAVMAVLTVISTVISIIEGVLELVEMLIGPQSDVKTKDFQGRILAKDDLNPVHYYGGQYGVTKTLTWETKINNKRQSYLGFNVSTFHGAIHTGSENLGNVFFPMVNLRHTQAEADDGWVLKTVNTKLLWYGGQQCVNGTCYPTVETIQVEGKTVPVYYLKTQYLVQRGGDAIPKSYVFRMRADQAPNCIEE